MTKMLQKLLVGATASAMMLSLAACGGNAPSSGSSTGSTSAASATPTTYKSNERGSGSPVRQRRLSGSDF